MQKPVKLLRNGVAFLLRIVGMLIAGTGFMLVVISFQVRSK